jgi:HEAT repeat protein
MSKHWLWLGCLALAAGCAPPDPESTQDYVRDDHRLGDVINDVRSSDDAVSLDAAALLARYGPEDKAALPALIKAATEDPDPRVRIATIRAMSHILPPTRESEAAINKAMNDTDPTVRKFAIHACHDMFHKEAPPPENPPSP